MKTNTLDQVTTTSEPGTRRRVPKIGRRIGVGLLTLTAIILMLCSILPVILLFFITAVPVWIATILALVEVSIIIGMLRWTRTPLSLAGALVGLLFVAVLAVLLSQRFATTPPITNADGDITPGSIASLESVELNGSTQWMTIRGHSDDLPVLLFLSGGPGGSELVMTRRYLGDLEQHFIVVNWDQPGVGKSYNAVPRDELTPERYVEDAHTLTLHLRERFDQDKVYLFGESWGSILGVWLVQQYPEHYHALVTTGQMVAPVENDIQMYDFATELAADRGRTGTVERLRQNGPPPYDRSELLGKFQTMNSIVNDYMHAHAQGEGTSHNLMFDSLGAQEYGLVDKVYWGLSLLNTFPHVYSQLNDVDFRTQATTLEVPVYFIKGRWDINASNSLLEEYYATLEAPHKELIWFADSAHTPSWDEPTRFINVMMHTVLAQTPPH